MHDSERTVRIDIRSFIEKIEGGLGRSQDHSSLVEDLKLYDVTCAPLAVAFFIKWGSLYHTYQTIDDISSMACVREHRTGYQ